jgi:hypothetical protein
MNVLSRTYSLTQYEVAHKAAINTLLAEKMVIPCLKMVNGLFHMKRKYTSKENCFQTHSLQFCGHLTQQRKLTAFIHSKLCTPGIFTHKLPATFSLLYTGWCCTYKRSLWTKYRLKFHSSQHDHYSASQSQEFNIITYIYCCNYSSFAATSIVCEIFTILLCHAEYLTPSPLWKEQFHCTEEYAVHYAQNNSTRVKYTVILICFSCQSVYWYILF